MVDFHYLMLRATPFWPAVGKSPSSMIPLSLPVAGWVEASGPMNFREQYHFCLGFFVGNSCVWHWIYVIIIYYI